MISEVNNKLINAMINIAPPNLARPKLEDIFEMGTTASKLRQKLQRSSTFYGGLYELYGPVARLSPKLARKGEHTWSDLGLIQMPSLFFSFIIPTSPAE